MLADLRQPKLYPTMLRTSPNSAEAVCTSSRGMNTWQTFYVTERCIIRHFVRLIQFEPLALAMKPKYTYGVPPMHCHSAKIQLALSTVYRKKIYHEASYLDACNSDV